MDLTFVFAGGGTGGHIYPGLAVADELRARAREGGRTVRIVWFGNAAGMDRGIVEKSGSVDTFVGIPSGKLRRYASFRNVTDGFKILAGLVKSLFMLARLRPALVFSKGGFVSVPPCAAAALLKIPVVTHECDFTPGLATRLNARFAAKILVSYQETVAFLPQKQRARALVTGNPVRPAFYAADSARGRAFLFAGRTDVDAAKPVLLVLGGSLGAHQINTLIVENLDWLCERFTVVHQCGQADADSMPQSRPGYFLHPFIHKEMCDVIACADIVLSRAGANSLWECAVLAKPLVLIPLCGAGTRGDQVDNAKFFVEKGAAKMLLGEDADAEHVQAALESLLDGEKRAAMSAACRALSAGERPAARIAAIIGEAAE